MAQKVSKIVVRLEPSTRMTLKTADLTANSIQPMTRVQDTAIQVLKERIVESKFIAPLVVVNRRQRYIICDGHRRWRSAQELGVESLQCDVLTNVDAEALFVYLNGGIRAMKGEAWLTVFAHSLENDPQSTILRIMPVGVRKQIEEMVDIFGQRRVIEIGKDGKQSPGLSQSVVRLEGILRTYGYSLPRRQVGEWVLREKAQRYIIDVNKHMTRSAANQLYARVRDGKALPKRATAVKTRVA